MSSLRNAVRRRPYKERAQPKARSQLGLLEKHKDYVLRAKDYNTKQARIKSLREKAANRNPEEFYHGMIRAKTDGGVHTLAQPGSTPVPMRTMRVLKAQDAAYLGAKRSSESRQIERLRASLHGLDPAADNADGGAVASGTHTLFVEDEAAAARFDAATHFDTAPELADRRFNRLRTESLATERVRIPKEVSALAESDPRALSKWLGSVHRQKRAAYAELEQRLGRKAKIDAEAATIEQQRALMGKGAKKKRKVAVAPPPGGGAATTRAVYKWKAERKR
jgi:U3 small nucleolar RNA-associated protein 11